jgi:protein gp37
MEGSKIEWTDNTWNIAVGCTKVSEGCKYCYMMRDFSRRKWDVDGNVIRTKDKTFFKPLEWQNKGLKSLNGGMLKVFTSSLTDVFHPTCDEFRDEFWDVIRKCHNMVFQILTKRPERIKDNLPPDWGDGWKNVALGVSVETQKRGVERIRVLADIPAKTKFVSFEPLLEWIDVREIYGMECIDWVIIGGESGNLTGKWGFRECEMWWIDDLVNTLKGVFCIPIFIKQLGTHLAKKHEWKVGRNGVDLNGLPDEWKHLNLKEFPDEWS